MTRVRILGREDVSLEYELVTSETAREALSSYDRVESEVEIRNSVVYRTSSLGGALASLNDLDWYLTRYARFSEVLEPSVSTHEWISRSLARKLYEREVDPEDTTEYYLVRGVVDGELREPVYGKEEPPEYDLYDTDDVTVTRISEDEF